MNFFANPNWIKPYEYPFERLSQVPQSVFDDINARLDQRISRNPLVSIVIAAYNEEINLLRTISTLSALQTAIPYNIIVVNNNSSDRTQETMDKLHIQRLFQPIQGCGPARQMGMEHATSQYILLADADCLYPPNWLNEMLKKLQQPGVSCVYGRYSFIAPLDIPRWQCSVHETLKDVMAEIRHIKRPYLNAYGMSMGFVREDGIKVGFIPSNTRGEDGRLCFDLMQYGRVVQMKTASARTWTPPRTILNEGTLLHGLKIRVSRELARAFSYLVPHPPHDTKTSKN